MIDMVCALAVAAVDVSFPLVSRYMMYELLPDKLYQTVFTVGIIVVCAFLLRSLLNYTITYFGHMFGIRVEADIRQDLYRHFQELDFDYFDKNRTGVLMNRLTGDLFELTELAHHGPEDLMISSITITGALIVMFSMEWRLALVVVAIVPIFVAILLLCKSSMMNASGKVKQKMAGINADIESTLSGMKTSKAFDNAAVDYARFERSNDMFKNSKGGYYKAMGRFNACMEFFVCFLQIAVIMIGGWLIMGDRMNYIDLITFNLYITTFVTPVRKLATMMEIFTNGMAGLKRFVEIMRLEASIKEASDAQELGKVEGRLKLDEVVFGYKENKEVLHGISLDVKAGESIAIVGHSGGGKSTLCQLIPRFYDVDGGSITIDGANVTGLSEHKRAKFLGRVFQDPMTGTAATMSIEENLAMANRRGQMRTLKWHIAKGEREHFKDLLQMLDLGLENRLSDKVGLLSGGQRQAVTLLMATLKQPKLLLLDEHTAALDPKTAAKVLQLSDEIISRNKLTALMVTHNMKDAITHGNRLVMLHEGKVILDIAGEDKKKLTVDDLLHQFEVISGTEFANDRALLS